MFVNLDCQNLTISLILYVFDMYGIITFYPT